MGTLTVGILKNVSFLRWITNSTIKITVSPIIANSLLPQNLHSLRLTCSTWRCQLGKRYRFDCGSSILIKWAYITPSRWIWVKKGVSLRENKCAKGGHQPLSWRWLPVTFSFSYCRLVGWLRFDVGEDWTTSVFSRTWRTFCMTSSHRGKIISRWRVKVTKHIWWVNIFSSSLIYKYKIFNDTQIRSNNWQ